MAFEFGEAVPILPPMAWTKLYLDAEIRPNRSLTNRGFLILIGLITAVNLASGLMFLSLGAPLVPVFLGLDVLAVTVAFLASFRAAKVIERVRVSSYHVRVTREAGDDVRLLWESPTIFTRVTTERDDEDRVTALHLGLSGRTTAIAAALGPRERGEFARTLEDAIWQAKRGT